MKRRVRLGTQRAAGNRARVLVVDDEQNLCRILMARLGKEGYQADAAYDGAQALQRVAALAYDLVLLDLRMPVLGGLEALPEIRRCCPGARVIVMTAYDSPEAISAALSAGADAYLTKPFDLDRVVTAVAEALICHAGVRAGSAPAPNGAIG